MSKFCGDLFSSLRGEKTSRLYHESAIFPSVRRHKKWTLSKGRLFDSVHFCLLYHIHFVCSIKGLLNFTQNLHNLALKFLQAVSVKKSSFW